MSESIQLLYKNIETLCKTESETALIEFLSTNGLELIQKLSNIDTLKTLSPNQCRDFGLFLIKLIPICYRHVSSDNLEIVLNDMPSIKACFDKEVNSNYKITTFNIFETLDLIFNTILALFYFHSNDDNCRSITLISEINSVYIQIAQEFLKVTLPQLSNDLKIIWFYRKFLRTLLAIFRQIISVKPESFNSNFTSNSISSLITNIYNYLSSQSTVTLSTFLIQYAFDTLKGFALLILKLFHDIRQMNSVQQYTIHVIISLLNQFSTSDYFSLFALLTNIPENERYSKELLEDCSNLLKRIKMYRLTKWPVKHGRRFAKINWDYSSEESCLLHHHQNLFELTVNSRNESDENNDIRNDNCIHNLSKRVCLVAFIYDKLLRLSIKQLECSKPSFSFIHDCLSYLIAYGSCSCYSLSHYRTLLSKINHLKADESIINSLEKQTIKLLRQTFRLISNCSNKTHYNYRYQHSDPKLSDNYLFWSYIANHLFQRSSHFSSSLARSFANLIQFCSMNEKQSALNNSIIPTLEYYYSILSTHNSENNELIQNIIEALPTLLLDITVDKNFVKLSDTIIKLSTLIPSLFNCTLPVLGCLLTSISDCSEIDISDSYVQFIIELVQSWNLSNDAIDNLCQILIILLQKSSLFRTSFYKSSCHSNLYQQFQLMLDNGQPIQLSLIACVLVSTSYCSKTENDQFSYKNILQKLKMYSENHRYNLSWFNLLVRLSLSQQYRSKRTKWENSNQFKTKLSNETDDEYLVKSSIGTNVDMENIVDNNNNNDDDNYLGDIELSSDDVSSTTVSQRNHAIYSNLILFPELVSLGLEYAWKNVDDEWNDQQATNKTSAYVINLNAYLEILLGLVRSSHYNNIVLKNLNIDGFLFTILTKVVPRSTFPHKDTLVTLTLTLLQLLWSQSMTVNQLDQCFKLILSHRSFVSPIVHLFQSLVNQIDSDQPRSFCSMPSSSIMTSKGMHSSRLTLDQLSSLKYPQIENDQTLSSESVSTIRKIALVTESLKNVQIQFPLTISLWLRVNYPFEKNDKIDDKNTDFNKKGAHLIFLHILTLQHLGVQLQFWLDAKPSIILKVFNVSSTDKTDQSNNSIISLHDLPKGRWCHVCITISKTTKSIRVCLNGRPDSSLVHILPNFNSTNSSQPWSMSLGQQSLDICTPFYFDLGSILLFDKIDLSKATNNNYIPAYLFSLGSDHWHFLSGCQQQQAFINYWIYQRFTRVHPYISIDTFISEQNSWHNSLKRSLFATYSSNNPWTLFLFNFNSDTTDEISTSRLNKLLTFRSLAAPSSSPSLLLNTVTSTNDENSSPIVTTMSLPSKISLEQSSNILNICEQIGGILNFIYLFGKIIEVNAYQSSTTLHHITDIVFTSIWKIKSYYDLFNSLDGYRLIVKILTTNECTRHISNKFLEILFNKSMILEQKRLYDINLCCLILLDWKIWYNHSEIYYRILETLNDLLSDNKNWKYYHINRQLFKIYYTLERFLTLCFELTNEQQQIIIDERLAKLLINIIEALLENDINVIALLMNFVLFLHPLIKTYVTYSKENFYFIIRLFNYFQQREKVNRKFIEISTDMKNIDNETNSKTTLNKSNNDKDNLNIRKSHSFSDLTSSTLLIGNENESYNSRRTHQLTVSNVSQTLTTSKTFNNELNKSLRKDPDHDIDHLSTGVLRLLTNLALTVSDSLMMKLIDHVFRLNIIIVLLLDASMAKRIQCIKLLDIVLKRMDNDKVSNDVLKLDLHIMLANQIYHQLDGRHNEKELVEACVSIALQRPVQFDLSLSLNQHIDDPDQYFSIVSSSTINYRSQVGLTLILSIIEKLSMTNVLLCHLILNLLDEIIQRSTDTNRCFLIDIGLTQVLFNTLSSGILTYQEKTIFHVQKCLNSLLVAMFTTIVKDDTLFLSIIDNIMYMMKINQDDIEDDDSSRSYRRILHQTLSSMLNSIVDTIEKPPIKKLVSYQSSVRRTSADDLTKNAVIESCERFRRFLDKSLDYILLFHKECFLFENFSLRLVNISLIGIAYIIENRSDHFNNRHLMPIIMLRCGDMMKQFAQKLLPIVLDPSKQRFVFRVLVLKHIIDQPNAKGIMEYLVSNDTSSYLYQQILIYLYQLSKATPAESDLEQIGNTNGNLSENSRRSFDSGRSTILTRRNNLTTSSDDDSSSHTINIATEQNVIKKTVKPEVKIQITSEMTCLSDDEQSRGQFSSSSSTKDEQNITINAKNYSHSPSLSLSVSSVSSELPLLTQASISNYQNIIESFRELMRTINIQLPATNDANTVQNRALKDYLLGISASTPASTFQNTSRARSHRHSFNWPASVTTTSDSEPLHKLSKSPSPELGRRLSHFLSPTASTPSPVVVSWSMIIDEKCAEYAVHLQQIVDTLQKRPTLSQKNALRTMIDSNTLKVTALAMEMTQEVIGLQSFERKKFLEHLRSAQSLDLSIKHLWHQLISQLTHEYGIWFELSSYPKFWELDATENPRRERRRLQRAYCLMEQQYFQSHIAGETLVNPPLSYLFDARHYQTMNIQTVLYRNERIEFQCRCMNVTPNVEVKGELLVGATRIYFVADEQLSATSKNKRNISATTTIGYNYQSFNDNSHSFSLAIDDICEMYKRRYMLKDIALELFFINGITLLIAHVSINEREILYRLLIKRNLIHFKSPETISEVQALWKQGRMNNFDYLMQINKLAGRTYLDLMQYPVYPYVVANYKTSVLDLRSSSNYRNLSKPIAIQHAEKEEKFIDIYNTLVDTQKMTKMQQEDYEKQNQTTGPVTSHPLEPYHYASLYSNTGVVLHYLVRLLPYTRMFLDYQDNNFDCPDRTFHDVDTSYWLSSYESTSDFKEIIPEFYYLYEFLLNRQGFNFGKRQNGEAVSNVNIPPWSKGQARLFVYGLRQALESDYVTAHLHQWIDLIFGYKQTGKAALDAINVYHPGCYYGFPIDNISDGVLQNAYYGIIRTYGQVPKQLFLQTHPSANSNNSSILSSFTNSNGNDKRNSERTYLESNLPLNSIHRHIIGIRWGDFIGSYDMPSPECVKVYECPMQVFSFVALYTSSIVICLPSSSLIIYNSQMSSESIAEQISSSQSNSSKLPTDFMIALKWNTPDSIVRCRQLKQMKNWYSFLVPIDDQDKITCCASIDYRILFMGKTSGLIEIYRIQRNKNSPVGIELIKRYLPFIAHRSPITCLHVNRQFSLLISASADGMLTLWDTNRLSYVRTYKQDSQTIYHLTSSETTGDIAYLSSSGNQWHLSYLTCNCDLVGCLTFTDQINCLCFTSAPEGTCVNVLFGGFENGLIYMWSTWDLTLLRRLDFQQLRSSPIMSMRVSKPDQRRLYVSDRDRHLFVIENRATSSSSTSQLPEVFFLS